MAVPFKFQILTPESVLLEEEISSLTVPGTEGYLGVLAHHAPLISGLVAGKVTVRDTAGSLSYFSIGGGFVEVSHNKAVVLADSVEPAGAIDVERARKSLERARERLAAKSKDIEIDRARASMTRALNRINVFQEHGR